MKLYNTLSRKKEEFVPIKKGEVGIYSCGPTVYWNQHIGNMYAFLNWDVLVRSFRYLGLKVKWVMNITDVGHMTSDGDSGEDKMEKGAKREGISPEEVAKKYEEQFLESLDLLNIVRPDVLPRATEHIREQIELAKKIDKNGFAYKTKTGLVFDTGKFADYAKFANLKLDKLEVGKRVAVDKDKKHPWDFLLWVTNQPKHKMLWDSPWGKGFPGWHLECTAMSTKYLGDKFDIHTGGMEHIAVHHTNEIAQGQGAYGANTANFWLHNGWLKLKDGKMSKSEGGTWTMQDLVKNDFEPMAFRCLVLMSHYRKGLEFSLKSLEAAEIGLLRLRGMVAKWRKLSEKKGKVEKSYKKEFEEKISDDLSMPEVMALVWKLADSEVKNEDKLATLLDFDQVLGLGLAGEKIMEVPAKVRKLAEERWKARKAGDWKKSDELRGEIEGAGWRVKDGEDGYELEKR